jgi:hypothetical protein
MSVSTRTAQQPLGYGPLGAALVTIALAIILAAAFAFGALGSSKATVNTGPASVPVPGHLNDPASYDMGIPGSGVTNHGYNGDPGFAPRPGQNASGAGSNGPRLRPQ